MPRIGLALLLFIGGFALYVGAVVAFADLVIGRHWLVELIYFLLAGIAWAWPARALMFWAARGPKPAQKV